MSRLNFATRTHIFTIIDGECLIERADGSIVATKKFKGHKVRENRRKRSARGKAK
jgi:hypothetical protein